MSHATCDHMHVHVITCIQQMPDHIMSRHVTSPYLGLEGEEVPVGPADGVADPV